MSQNILEQSEYQVLPPKGTGQIRCRGPVSSFSHAITAQSSAIPARSKEHYQVSWKGISVCSDWSIMGKDMRRQVRGNNWILLYDEERPTKGPFVTATLYPFVVIILSQASRISSQSLYVRISKTDSNAMKNKCCLNLGWRRVCPFLPMEERDRLPFLPR